MGSIWDQFNAGMDDAKITTRSDVILRTITVGPVLWATFFLPDISTWKRVRDFLGRYVSGLCDL